MPLTRKEQLLVRLSTAIVVGNWEAAREARRAASAAEPDREWREAVLQTHLFAGFPRLVQAFGELAAVGGMGKPTPEELEGEEFEASRGRELFDTIYGDGSGAVRELLDGYHDDFGSWIAEHAYTRVLARPGLAADRRELLASCALAALGQERQFASHARGSLRCGASYEELLEALDSAADLIGPERLERARRIVERFKS